MPDTERRTLKGHQTRTVPRVAAWILVLIGLGLIAAGGALVLVGAGTLRPESHVPVPTPVPYAIGVVFVVLGAWLLAIRIGDGLRDARAARLRRTMPGAPWLADHPWDPAGARDETGRRAIAAAALAVTLALFLVPFNWVAFSPRSGILIWGRILFVVVTGVFDVLTVIVAGYAAYLGWRRARFGSVFLRFERFPMVLGTSARVWLRVPRAPAECRLTAALRCIEERYVADGDSSSTLSEQVWAETLPVDPAWGRIGEGWNLPIALRLPLGPYETRLADRPPRYWELEVHGAAPGVDFGAIFLLPVYTALAAPS
ncbi:MAG TPA: hypothetical protein VHO73_07180 [Methylomirabilota bacterium]|nr:hypothetical protein [Methylomirabilota bacterium]